MSRLPVLALALLALGCAPKGRVVEDMPAWRTEDGRRSLRYELVESLIESGSTQEALLMIAKMREEGESDRVLDLYQGQALAREGFATESERMLLQYRESAPRDARPLKTLGVIYAESERTPEAIAVLRKAVALDDGDAAAWNNLGFLLLSEHQYLEAQEALQQAVALDGTQARYRNNLGFALAANGHYRKAFEAFQSVGTPDTAHYNVAVAYELAGDHVAATRHYEQALEYNPNHTASKEAIERLESVEEENE
jgi:Flp pilus assembly protein TadD